MKAARLYGKGDLRVVDVPVPDVEEGGMLLRVRAATVCGTDLRMFANGSAGIDEEHPLTLCHEFSGTIEKLGKGVSGYEAGQRVSVAPNIGCGICGMCVSGDSHHCKELRAFGVNIDGAFAEYVGIPAAAVANGNVTPIGENVSFEAAAANEAFACVYNSFERYGVNPGDTVLIIGAGAIGMMHAGLALMAGAAKVILNDLSESRLAECKAIEPRIITVSKDLKEAVDIETGGAGANVVITACSVAAVQESAFDYAALNGRVNFFGGLPAGKDARLDTNQIHYKQLQVSGTTRSSHGHYRKTLEFISKGLVDVDALVTGRYPIDSVRQAFDNAAQQKGLKQAIVFG
ncbi:MAG: alcohol dehydrogenase catalytic domain-containing protein [Clostridiales Family XIII bacterium]|jgi:L-iditol 2-dehydrogenase|nr:alcohol dehydrogenase catalytic domain-containing protein [Clostridiales Family XIII bacterium]